MSFYRKKKCSMFTTKYGWWCNSASVIQSTTIHILILATRYVNIPNATTWIQLLMGWSHRMTKMNILSQRGSCDSARYREAFKAHVGQICVPLINVITYHSPKFIWNSISFILIGSFSVVYTYYCSIRYQCFNCRHYSIYDKYTPAKCWNTLNLCDWQFFNGPYDWHKYFGN